MPYVPQENKPFNEDLIETALTMDDEDAVAYLGKYAPSPGDRNYCWTRWVIRKEPKRYHEHSHYIGLIFKVAAELDNFGDSLCMLMEYYRRVMVPYEQEKIEQNGDIEGFPPETR